MPRVMPGATGEIVNNIFFGYGIAGGDRLYMENTKSKLAEQRTVRVVGNLWIPAKDVSGEGPIVSVGKLSDASMAKIYFRGNAQLALDGSIKTSDSGAPADFLLAEDTVIQPNDQAETKLANDLEAILSECVGARAARDERDEYDQFVLRLLKDRAGGPVDTVIPDRNSLNGFPVVNAKFVYPSRGREITPIPPKESRRPDSRTYSALEEWLWS